VTLRSTDLERRREAWYANPDRSPSLWLCLPCWEGLRATGVVDRMSIALGNCARCSRRSHLFELWPFEIRMKDDDREEIVADFKVQENRIRRIAKRRGFVIGKNRRRDPLGIGYGRWWAYREGTSPDRAVHGSLDEIEAIVTRA
jgi:hypothetical protein